jgi:type 1 fimbria pilin
MRNSPELIRSGDSYVIKNQISKIALISLLSLFSDSALVNASPKNWDVDGMNGTLYVTGKLLQSTCFLAPESTEQSLDLGMTPMYQLDRPGVVTHPVQFDIVLDGCPEVNSYAESPEKLRGALFLYSQPTVRLTITGDSEPTDGRLFRVHGSTSGVGLRLEDPNGEQLYPDMPSRPYPLLSGRNVLNLKAQLWRNSTPFTPGEWQSTVNIGLEYE